jgi:hypothetical protein
MVELLDKETANRDSLDLWDIENELAAIGVPFWALSWDDEFLMAENLQNYFAEVIAQLSHICRESDKLMVFEKEDLKAKKIGWITLRNKYRQLDLSERQRILLDLIKENKYLSEKYAY